MPFRPSRWILFAPIAALPFLAGLFIQARDLQSDIARRVEAEVARTGAEAVQVEVSGRDVRLRGEVPFPDWRDRSVAAASGTWGVRRVESEIRVVEPPPLPAPSAGSLETRERQPRITGSWGSAAADRLMVRLGETAYRLGESPELTVDGDSWSLVPGTPLADGTYAIAVEVGDRYGRTATAAETATLRVDATPPQAPSVVPVTVTGPPFTVSGTWAEGDAVSLTVRLGDRTWQLGRDNALATDGKGTWTLTVDAPLQPGTHDIAVETADRLGNVAGVSMPAAVTVETPPDMPAPTVDPVISRSPTPELRGTWPSAVASSLKVTVGADSYVLGQAPELTTDGDSWLLKISRALADGVHAVGVEASDRWGRTVSLSGPATVTIDTVPPAPPTVAPVNVSSQPFTIRGTWPEGDAISLAVGLGERLWQLGRDAALVSDGAGSWSLTPDVELPPGAHDLVVETADPAGNTTRLAAPGAVVIAPPPPPPPPPVMAAPTVVAATETVARPVIRGTWSEMAATRLEVEVAGRVHVLGTDPELSSDGIGNWSLAVSEPLPEGVHDVSVRSTDAAGRVLADSSRNELVIDARGPEAPVIDLHAGFESPRRITGRWDWENARHLAVGIPALGLREDLGGGRLTSASGRWSLELSEPLPPGSHDVIAEAIDSRGRKASDQTRFEILVKEPPPAPPPSPAMDPPTVVPFAGNAVPPQIGGTWHEGVARRLTVSVEGRSIRISATLGADPALSSDGVGNWSLKLPETLAPGIYEVVAETEDAAGRVLRDATTGELGIEAPPPPPAPEMAAPTVIPYAGEGVPAMVRGTWDESVASALRVTVEGAGISATLGTDPALSSDGAGNWSLKLPETLAPGIYEVIAETEDAAGRVLRDATTGELGIEAPPPPPAPPFDCEAAFEAIDSIDTIRFGFDRWDLPADKLDALRKVADLLNDRRCSDRILEVEGHADYLGGRLYNEALSIRRAQTVIDALVAAGLPETRIRLQAFGKRDPEDPDRTMEARARNRRVILKMIKQGGAQ